MNLRQTQKNVEKDVINYADMKILAKVNCIKNPSEREIKEAKNKDPKSDFVHCMFPIYEGKKIVWYWWAYLHNQHAGKWSQHGSFWK